MLLQQFLDGCSAKVIDPDFHRMKWYNDFIQDELLLYLCEDQMPHSAERVAASRSEFIHKVVNEYMSRRKKPHEAERRVEDKEKLEKPSNLVVKTEVTQIR